MERTTKKEIIKILIEGNAQEWQQSEPGSKERREIKKNIFSITEKLKINIEKKWEFIIEEMEKFKQEKKEKEIWKDIEKFPGYQTSTFFRIRRKTEKGFSYLKPYYKNSKRKNGNTKKTLVVKIKNKEVCLIPLIARAFIPKPSPSHTNIYYIDESQKKLDLKNLIWLTKEELGERTGNKIENKFKIGYFKEGKLIKTFESARKAGKEMNCSYQTVLDYTKGKVEKKLIDLRRIE
jgi:hypothetical protein